MFFLVDHKKKVIFGWTPKCGCTFVKNLFYFLTDTVPKNGKIHGPHSNHPLPKNHREYKIIIIVRNPYERIISGFLDKYKKKGEFHHLWPPEIPLTFRTFVNALHAEGTGKRVESHHFSPQLGCKWIPDIKVYRVYDIKAIDYAHLEQLYKKEIPEEVLNFKIGHENTTTDPINFPVYDLTINQYEGKRPTLTQFYTKGMRDKVANFYKSDFAFLDLYKIPYNAPMID
jgi:hypothetical protein